MALIHHQVLEVLEQQQVFQEALYLFQVVAEVVMHLEVVLDQVVQVEAVQVGSLVQE